MNATLLTVNLTTKTPNLGSGTWTPATYSFGEALSLALRFAEDIDGVTTEPVLDIRAMKAVLGGEDERPVSGTWKLQIGSGASTGANTTAALEYNIAATKLQAAIVALTDVVTAYGSPVVQQVDGSWLIVFGTGLVVVPLTVRHNRLFPTCLGQISAEEIDAQWHHEIRLTQVPVAISDTLDVVLPDPPTITEVVAGSTSGGFSTNAVQSLKIPPAFRASYVLKLGFAQTARLTIADDVTTIQAALIAVLGNVVSVTDGATGEALIEFIGEMKGTDVDLLEVLALDPPPGDLTFTLELDKAPLRTWLRRERLVVLPLEVWITTADADDVLTKRRAFRVDVPLQRSVDFDELSVVPVTDWLRPPSPVDYVPRSTGTVFTGTKSQAFVVGDGAATVFALAHSLSTEDIRAFGRMNASGGRQLIHGTDFTAVIDNSGQVTVTSLIGAPALNTWALYLEAVEPVAAFAGHTHTIGEVTGLRDELDAIEASLQSVLDLLPSAPVGSSGSTSTAAIEWPLPDVQDAFPGSVVRSSAGVIDLSKLPRPNFLLPAAHDASLTSVTTTLPGSPSVGDVIVNNSGGVLTINGAGGTRSSTIAVGEFAAWDGRRWYPVSRGSSTSTSYFPRDFERELFMFEVEKEMLRAGLTLSVNFSLATQLFQAADRTQISRAQYAVVIEHGTLPSQGAPLASAVNITSNITVPVTIALKDGAPLGTFTAVASTDVLTVTGTMPANGDVVTIGTTGGGLDATLSYVARDVSGATCKLAGFTNTENLYGIVWNATPLLTHRFFLGPVPVPRKYGVQILSSAAGVLSANQLFNDFARAADSVPVSASVALRARLIDFDTENSVANAKGTVFFKLSGGTAKLI